MGFDKGKVVPLHIEKMAYGGRGIAKVDGFVIFVRGAMTGDKVLAKVQKKKRDYAEADLVEVLIPSQERVKPPCPYCGECGGCQWQHVAYERQLEYKKAHIKESLEHIGDIKGIPIRDTIPSPETFGYRNKMEFSFSDRCWLPTQDFQEGSNKTDFALGLHVPGTYHRVLDVKSCLLVPQTGNEILREVKAYSKKSGLQPYGLKTHQGFWRFLVVRHSKAFDEWMVNVVTAGEQRDALEGLSEALISCLHGLGTVVNTINSRKASIATGERQSILRGDGYIKDTIGSSTFQISADSFFQTNSLGAEALYETVAEYAELKGAETVLDLYSGTGTIPIFLAGKAGSITGIEINESAVRDARINCRINGIDNCNFICGDIKNQLSEIRVRPDVVIIDPPRAGMHRDVLSQVLALAAKRIVYVSCNPSTLAKDLSGLAEAYDLLEVQPVDMFPHTYHSEVVAKLHWKG